MLSVVAPLIDCQTARNDSSLGVHNSSPFGDLLISLGDLVIALGGLLVALGGLLTA